VYGGALQLRWTFSAERYDRQTIATWPKPIARSCWRWSALPGRWQRQLHAVGLPLAQLTQAQIDALPVPAAQIEDVYPLTPMQEGMLLHTLLEPGTGLYYMQDRYRINSALDPERFAQAWQAVVARHEALRASFSWNAARRCCRSSTNRATRRWTTRTGAASQTTPRRRLQALQAGREAGFDLLSEAPFHLRLVRVADERYWFMMSNHHILIDAWCRSLLMNDFFESTRPSAKAVRRNCRCRRATATTSAGCNARAWRGAPGGRPTWPVSNAPRRSPATARCHDHAGSGMVVGDCYTRLDVTEGAACANWPRPIS
jgi:hypothetical protein